MWSTIYPNNTRDVYFYIYSVSAYMAHGIDRRKLEKKYRTPRIVDTALNIWESNDIFQFQFIRKFLLQPKDNYIFFYLK